MDILIMSMSILIEKQVSPYKCYNYLNTQTFRGTNSYIPIHHPCRTSVNIKKNIVRYKVE